ncbi:hypothetical protein C7447_101960 [Tenacibaculum adriaticum]|uniref:Bacteriocin-like protein n=1 Tax=Tenacibaculum adriaticum TaxID=413713 RepID=A0A5S5DWM6_9FLAO|nr:hypothetical protein [Tenacibaculum adriaticum]TYQ00348.1 hypothetical protein C7447_101960 [Tenacibaculum adriaticum]
MKKQILNLGKALNRSEQKTINGGKKQCILPWGDGTCSEYGLQCAERQCQLLPF